MNKINYKEYGGDTHQLFLRYHLMGIKEDAEFKVEHEMLLLGFYMTVQALRYLEKWHYLNSPNTDKHDGESVKELMGTLKRHLTETLNKIDDEEDPLNLDDPLDMKNFQNVITIKDHPNRRQFFHNNEWGLVGEAVSEMWIQPVDGDDEPRKTPQHYIRLEAEEELNRLEENAMDEVDDIIYSNPKFRSFIYEET